MSEIATEQKLTPPGPAASPEGLQQLEKQIVEPMVEEAPAPAAKGVVLCIPALNSEKQVGKAVSKALKFVNKVIVCDDGSIDSTATRAREAGAFVVQHREGLGLGRTMSDLIEEAVKSEPQIVVTMDMERHNDPEQIPELIEPIRKDEADICIGIHEEAGVPVMGSEFLALSSKALAARSRDDFFTSMGSNDQMAVAIASGLRVKLVTFKTAALPPPAASKPKEGASAQARWDSFLRRVIVERPFFFIGAPGIELSIAGLALMVVALVSYNSGAKLNIPLIVVGGIALIVGLFFLLSFSVVYAVRHTLKGKPEPQK
jgi:hypothetical protein